MPWKASTITDTQLQIDTSFEIELQPLHEASTSQGAEPQETISETQDEENVQTDLLSTSQTQGTELDHYQLTRDHTRRTIRLPSKQDTDFVGYAFNCYTDNFDFEPKTYNQAIKFEVRQQWITAMNEEIDSLHLNRTWKLIQRPAD